MAKFRDRIEERYGRLLVVEHAGKNEKGKHLWRCKCDCGNEKIVSSDNLSSGKSKSCGCLKTDFLKRRGNQFGIFENREEAIMRVQYSHIKRRHAKFSGEIMSFEEFLSKSKQRCFYCGLEYSKEIQDRRNECISDGLCSDTVVKCNGIDRVDSGVGYTSGNTVPCCKYCNTAKNTMSKVEFYEWVKRVYEYNFK